MNSGRPEQGRGRVSPDARPGGRWRIGVLSNPSSGGNRNGMGEVRTLLANRPGVSHREVRTPGDVASALAHFAGEGVGVLAVNGGDGTVQAALTALFHRKPFDPPPLLAILRAGTSSMIARDVGIRGARIRGLRKLLAWADGESRDDAVILRRPVLRVEAGPDREPLHGMFFGAGAIVRGIEFFHSRMHPLGLRGEAGPGLTLARFLLAALFGNKDYAAPTSMTIAIDRQAPERRDCLLLLVSTLERLFLGLRPYLGAESGPLRYTAIGADPRHLLRVLPSLLRGRRTPLATPENGYVSRNVREVRLGLAGGFTLDGELYMPDVRDGAVLVREGGQASFLSL